MLQRMKINYIKNKIKTVIRFNKTSLKYIVHYSTYLKIINLPVAQYTTAWAYYILNQNFHWSYINNNL